MYWYVCSYCGRENTESAEICRGCGACIEHKHLIMSEHNSVFYPRVETNYKVTCSGYLLPAYETPLVYFPPNLALGSLI